MSRDRNDRGGLAPPLTKGAEHTAWVYNRKGVPNRLYVGGELAGAVFVCEGEKDVDTLHRLGYNAASGADGAGPGKWRKEYTEQLGRPPKKRD